MTDEDLVAKKLAAIETNVRELRELARVDRLQDDVKEQRFVAHTLQIAIQAAMDVASHVVSDDRLGEPRTNRELFDLLARAGWIDDGLASRMRDAAGFRNIVVHGYAAVDYEIVAHVVQHGVGDLLDFVAAVRARLRS